uniref:Uncharacterized protein n=1 Tax=Spongospora subterranea TaxID=70186 RepID=A0A0H5RTF8_9EUKA|eukprot:CRZ12024.1 hypothetical protein [Spongospora subterranea]
MKHAPQFPRSFPLTTLDSTGLSAVDSTTIEQRSNKDCSTPIKCCGQPCASRFRQIKAQISGFRFPKSGIRWMIICECRSRRHSNYRMLFLKESFQSYQELSAIVEHYSKELVFPL